MMSTFMSDRHAASPNAQGGSLKAARLHPSTLLVRWEIASRSRDWPAAITLAKALMITLPDEPVGWIYQALAQHGMGQVEEARETLLTAAREFPNDWQVAYNLACYSAELGDVAGAQNWLDRAIEVGDAAIVRCCAANEWSLRSLRIRG